MKNCTVYYRALRGLSVEQQRQMCAVAAKRLGVRIAAEYTHREFGDDRDEWIRRTRCTEIAMVARLEVIAQSRDEVKRPTVDFAAALQDVIQSCERLVEAASGTTSRDGKKWRDLVVSAGNIVAAGRLMTKHRARKMAAKRWANAKPGTVRLWHTPAMADELKRWSQHWRDPQYGNDVEAFEALPPKLRDEIGSPTSARRIFGKRRPGNKSAGGRPPAKRK